MMIKRALMLMVMVLMSAAAQAGVVLVDGATITYVSSARDAGDPAFIVLTQGGAGPCGGQWIGFYPANAPTVDSHKRAFAMAMLAFMTGQNVRIVNTSDGNCWGGGILDVYK